MTLQEFLIDKELMAVETLPASDNRLINVVFNNGQLMGVHVDNIPSNVTVVHRSPVVLENNFIMVDEFTFDTTEYLMLS